MIDVSILVSTVVAGYEWLRVWHERQADPAHLPEHAILVFKAFKTAYDAKDIDRLAFVINDDYQGDVFGVSSKTELLQVQRRVFSHMPWCVSPCLTVNVYGVLEDGPVAFRGIIDTRSRAKVFGLPVYTYDSAPLRCEIRPSGEYGIWRITEMFIQWELVKR